MFKIEIRCSYRINSESSLTTIVWRRSRHIMTYSYALLNDCGHTVKTLIYSLCIGTTCMLKYIISSCIYIYICICVCKCVCISTHTYMYISVCIYMYLQHWIWRLCPYKFTCIYIYIYTYMYTYTLIGIQLTIVNWPKTNGRIHCSCIK